MNREPLSGHESCLFSAESSFIAHFCLFSSVFFVFFLEVIIGGIDTIELWLIIIALLVSSKTKIG